MEKFDQAGAKKPLSKKRKIIYGSIIAIFVIMMILSNRGSSSPSSIPSAPEQTALIGDVAYLQSTAPILVAPTEANFDRATQLAVAKDITGISQMVLAGDIFTVPSGTQVRVISKDFPKTEVRIMDGDSVGLSGWVPYEFVSLTPPVAKTAPATDTAKPAPVTQKSSASITAETVPTKVQASVATAYCTTLTDCAGFKIKMNFHEDLATCSKNYTCKYHDESDGNEYVYYLTVRNDTVNGEVRSRNPNSGTEKSYANLYGSYDTQSSLLKVHYGTYTYPDIAEGYHGVDDAGKISGNQFVEDNGTVADVTYLPITVSDHIPKKNCLIKADKYSASDDVPIYYLPTSANYSKVTFSGDEWFCSEADAVAAGYSKALQ